MLICLHIVYGCFCVIKAELSNYNTELIVCKPGIVMSVPLQEKLDKPLVSSRKLTKIPT